MKKIIFIFTALFMTSFCFAKENVDYFGQSISCSVACPTTEEINAIPQISFSIFDRDLFGFELGFSYLNTKSHNFLFFYFGHSLNYVFQPSDNFIFSPIVQASIDTCFVNFEPAYGVTVKFQFDFLFDNRGFFIFYKFCNYFYFNPDLPSFDYKAIGIGYLWELLIFN